MICFRDMSFCSSACTNTECERHFGPEDLAAAKEWWGADDVPVAFGNFAKDCPDYRAPTIREEGRGYA